jgi:hypothetical protein
MSGKLSSLSRRLAKIERQLIDGARREELENCICRQLTVADPNKPEEFEAEMNETCPLHGFRRLGEIIEIQYIGRKNTKLDQLLEIYRARQSPRNFRLSQLRQVGLGLKRGCGEF